MAEVLAQGLQLPANIQAFAEERVRAGKSASVADVVREALDERKRAVLREAIGEGIAELDASLVSLMSSRSKRSSAEGESHPSSNGSPAFARRALRPLCLQLIPSSASIRAPISPARSQRAFLAGFLLMLASASHVFRDGQMHWTIRATCSLCGRETVAPLMDGSRRIATAAPP